MIQTNKDFYAKIDKLKKNLIQLKRYKFAQKIDDALTISTVSGEIIGEIKIVLSEMLEARMIQTAEPKILVNDALQYIDKILR